VESVPTEVADLLEQVRMPEQERLIHDSEYASRTVLGKGTQG